MCGGSYPGNCLSSRTEHGLETVTISAVHSVLPEQRLICTEWLHADCLADYYNVEPFSKKILGDPGAVCAHSGGAWREDASDPGLYRCL